MSINWATIYEEFIAGIWERESGVLPGAFDRPLLDQEELYEAIKSLWDQRGFEDLNPYMDGRNPFQQEYLLLEPKESTFADYCNAVTERLGGVTFGAQITRLERYSKVFRERITEVTEFLAARKGIPAGCFNGGAFFGTYSKTPFGIHTDPAGIITWPVLGHKRVLLWPGSYFDNEEMVLPISTSHKMVLKGVEHFEKDAIVVEADPGDLVYWPSSYWHVAKGKHGVHATVSLSYYYWNSIATMIGQAVQASLEQRLGDKAVYWGGWDKDAALPESIKLATEALRELIKDNSLDAKLLQHWRDMVKGGGFDPTASTFGLI